jgi:hypothetical protein
MTLPGERVLAAELDRTRRIIEDHPTRKRKRKQIK